MDPLDSALTKSRKNRKKNFRKHILHNFTIQYTHNISLHKNLNRAIYWYKTELKCKPDSLPPPVDFSPPKAPPISAPDVGIFTLTIPQSEPLGPSH